MPTDEDRSEIDALFEELANIIANSPVWPGDTISHRTANECVRRGWATRNKDGSFEPTASGEMIADQYGLMGDD